MSRRAAPAWRWLGAVWLCLPPLAAQNDVPLHQRAEMPLLMRRKAELVRMANAREPGELLGVVRELPDLYPGGRPQPDLTRCAETLAEARARLLGIARDDDAKTREALFLYAYPEIADPQTQQGIFLTVKALWPVPLREPARVTFRLRDASGHVVAELGFEQEVDAQLLSGYQVHREFPLQQLADGRYLAEALVAIGGRGPREHDQRVVSQVIVLRGFRDRWQRLQAQRRDLEGADPDRLGCLDAVMAEIARAVELGDPYQCTSRLDAHLAEAERRLVRLQQDQPVFVERAGEHWLGLHTSEGKLFSYRAYVPSSARARPAVAVLLPSAGGTHDDYFDMEGQGRLFELAERSGTVVLAPRTLSYAADATTLGDMLEQAGRLLALDVTRVDGYGTAAGGAQLLLDARRNPKRYRRLFLLGLVGLWKDDLQALRHVEFVMLVSSLSQHVERALALQALADEEGFRNLRVEVQSGVPQGLLAGFALDRLLEGK